MGCRNTVAVGEPSLLGDALTLVEAVIGDVDRTCSRFREDSELSRLNAAGGGDFDLSPLLEQALVAALRTAAMTGGLVDPTLGRRMNEIGYTVTFGDLPRTGPPLRLRAQTPVDWTGLAHDPTRHTLHVPPGVMLDLGASGKAWAADLAAHTAGERLNVPVAVCCGGDVAVGGPPLAGGWPVRIELETGAEQVQDVRVFDGGVATSGPGVRRWRRGEQELHHILDPATGLPAETPWAMVTVAGASCVDANAAATAAVIIGSAAPAWLDSRRLPARLVDGHGAIHLAGGWSS
jgi:FAD:protein FMN transferase